jgi:predicted nucleotidyltransferase
MLDVGRAIGKLNKVLTKGKFILMGPGRWGSRGDIKLGVNVTYSDINNTAVLIEVAQKRGDYIPDPSFGTHFFQDLVESGIRYIPLYPDDFGVVFNDRYLRDSQNIFGELLPDFAHLEDIIHVINVKQSSEGQVLQILMNADKNHALAMLSEEDVSVESHSVPSPRIRHGVREDHWRWRMQCVERIAALIDPERFGVKGVYVFGSTKNATAGPQSDIDILIHFEGDDNQRQELLAWLEGWSLSLSQMNEWRTGYKTHGLLDVNIITDEDIKNRTSYAVKIGATTDAALPIPMGTPQS